VLLPGIERAGYGRADVVRIAYHDSYDNLSAAQAQVQGAVLRFRSSGVTHVVLVDDNGVATLFFANNAESQSYRPRYGITSGSIMQTQLSAGLISRNQARGATGTGVNPVLDVPDGASKTGRYANRERRQCDEIMRAGGADITAATAESSALSYCDVMTVTKLAYDTARPTSVSSFIIAMEAIGQRFVSNSMLPVLLSPSRHDGLAGVYDEYYDEQAEAMAYRGGPQLLRRSRW
jgi:hypothetical protein